MKMTAAATTTFTATKRGSQGNTATGVDEGCRCRCWARRCRRRCRMVGWISLHSPVAAVAVIRRRMSFFALPACGHTDESIESAD